MPDDILEWIAKYVAVKIDRVRAGNLLTQEQLRKSFKHIALSEDLLNLPVPKVWHPERCEWRCPVSEPAPTKKRDFLFPASHFDGPIGLGSYS